VSRLLSDAQDRPLPAADRARLRLHLVMCHACRDVEAQFDFIRRAMRRLARTTRAGAEIASSRGI